jgi:hypothetical protein
LARRKYSGRHSSGANRQSNRRHNSPPQRREPMLNLRHKIAFKYDLEEILKYSDVDERYISTIVANIISKASQDSIKAAKRFIFESEEKGTLSPSVGRKIVLLLNRNTRFR